MKKLLTFCVLFFLSIFSFGQSTKFLSLENKLDISRPDELIVLKKDFLEKQFGPIPAGKFIVLHSDADLPLTVQHDDLNGDGEWDEVCFLYTFSPLQKLSLPVTLSDAPAILQSLSRAHVRLKKRGEDMIYSGDIRKEKMPLLALPNDFTKNPFPLYQTEGPAWENDKIAFRLYFDVRNSKDIYGKTTSALVMDTVGLAGDKYYHIYDKKWGMDILKVGKSLGAGSLALETKLPDGKDTIIRVGGNNIGLTSYKKIADGPVRALFKLYYENWDILGDKHKINVAEEISIWGGQYFYDSKVKIEEGAPSLKIVTGIPDFASKKLIDFTIGDSRLLSTYDRQSENNHNLGLAIITKNYYSPVISTVSTAGDVQNSYLMAMNNVENKGVRYRFYAAWEKSDKRFLTESGFVKYMKEEVAKYNSSIKVSW